MSLSIHFGFWDAALLSVITLQATAVSYLHQPRWKVLLFSLPLPFTLGSLALGEPIGVTHVVGFVLVLGFVNATRLLHYSAGVPIVGSIALAAGAYCAAGTVLARALPESNVLFWSAAGGAMALSAALFARSAHRHEPGHRSPLPLWIKLPAVAGVIFSLIVAKQALSGFMATFPMMGVVTAYEARHSLWTFSRQMPAVMLALVPMVATVRLAQGTLGMGAALLCGWAVFLSIFLPVAWRMWFAPGRAGRAAAVPGPAGAD